MINFFLNMWYCPTSLFSLSIWSNFFSWMSQGGHSEQLLFFALFYQSTPSCLKVVGGGWGGVVAHVIIESAPVQRIGFWGFLDLVLTLGQDLGPVETEDRDLGLTIFH